MERFVFMAGKPKPKEGQKFGRWTVLKYYAKGRYICKCDCGVERPVGTWGLTSGHSKSCGCYHSEVIREVGYRNATHGCDRVGRPTPEYTAWASMKSRCYYANSKDYKNYGGRGIIVCDRWLHSFENFLADMGLRPSKGHSLERNYVHGNYEPSNCRWATRKEQNRNSRWNRHLVFFGVSKCMAEWAELLNVRPEYFTKFVIFNHHHEPTIIDKLKKNGKWNDDILKS